MLARRDAQTMPSENVFASEPKPTQQLTADRKGIITLARKMQGSAFARFPTAIVGLR
jgi:hypothetical protein